MSPQSGILATPHIPLGLDIAGGLSILTPLGSIKEEQGREHSYTVDAGAFRVAIYEEAGKVGSVWYDDPSGRNSDAGREGKVKLYLERYGSLSNWELRTNNGWMIYWFNPKDRAAMVYGTHKDVMRFNQYHEPSA
jgi:hypothetical protein